MASFAVRTIPFSSDLETNDLLEERERERERERESVTSQSALKKRKSQDQIFFGFPRAKPHLTPLPTSQSLYFFIPLAGSFSHFSFILFSSFSFSVEHSLHSFKLSTGTSTPPPSPFPPSFFRQDYRKILRNP